MIFLKVGLISLVIMQHNLTEVCAAKRCYTLTINAFRTTETSEYKFYMRMNNNNSLHAVTKVLRPVNVPTWNFILFQYGRNSQNMMFNTSVNVCNFWANMKRLRVVAQLAEYILKRPNSGNLSLTCPLGVGTYTLENIHVPQELSAFKLFYRPNTTYGLFGNVYDQMSKKKYALKCSYEINATIYKLC